MKQTIKNEIRNWIHPLAVSFLFLRIALALGLAFDMTREDSEFITIVQMILVSAFAFIPAAVLGAIYEVPYKLWIFGETPDIKDIWRTGLGGQLGFGVACIFPAFPIALSNFLLLLSILLFLVDLYRCIKINK